MNAKDLFISCLEATPAERRRLLEESSADLRAEVERLLAAEEASAAEHFLEPADERPLARDLRRSIGGFLVGDVLGEGGMGIVYRAHQEQPRREVALKVLHHGSESAARTARFEAEADALARLQHPAISQIHATGTFESEGRTVPYIAMEFIRGEDLGRWAATLRPMSERLDLLVRIAAGVHHAHERGVIHRDLKPSNILVAESGQPKIVDFGVARLTERDDGLTRTGEIVGTLAYMSPEQADGRSADIDTRSDQYALGAIAYRLVSGRTPIEIEGKSLTEAARAITEMPPVPLRTIQRELPNGLDAVIETALAKNPANRYPSVAAFAADLERVRKGEPITVRPPTLGASLRRLIRNHRAATGVAIAALFVLSVLFVQLFRTNVDLKRAQDEARIQLERTDRALLLAEKRGEELAATGAQLEAALGEADRQRERALEDARAARAAEAKAVRAREEALRDRERALGIERTFMRLLIGPMGAANWDPQTPFATVVARFLADARGGLHGTPAATGNVRRAAALVLRSFGRYDDSLDLMNMAVDDFAADASTGSDHARIGLVHARVAQADLLVRLNRQQKARSVLQVALEEANALEHEDANVVRCTVLCQLGTLNLDLGDRPKALAQAQRALAFIEDHDLWSRRTLIADRLDLASTLWRLGKVAPARRILTTLLELADGTDTFGNRERMLVLRELALIEAAAGSAPAAERYGRQALALFQSDLHTPNLKAALLEVVSDAAADQKRLKEAIALAAEAAELLEGRDDELFRARVLTNLAIYHQSAQALRPSYDTVNRAVAILRELGESRPVKVQLDQALNCLAFTLSMGGDPGRAAEIMKECTSLRQQLFGERSVTWFDSVYSRALFIVRLSRLDEALELLEDLRRRDAEHAVGDYRELLPGVIEQVKGFQAAAKPRGGG